MNHPIVTITSILALLALAGVIVLQVMEMKLYMML